MFKIKTVFYSLFVITLSSSLYASTDVVGNYNQGPNPESSGVSQVVNNDSSLPQRPEDPSSPSANEPAHNDQHSLLNRMENPRDTAEPSPDASPEVAPAYNAPQDSAPNPQ